METQNASATGLTIDHVAIAVRDLNAAVEYYEQRLGFTVDERRETHGDNGAMSSVVVRRENLTFVLLQGTAEDSQISQYIDAYGPGVHHVALHTSDIKEMVADFQSRGADFSTRIVSSPSLSQTFTVRDPNSGMMIEIIQRDGNAGFEDGNVAGLFRELELTKNI